MFPYPFSFISPTASGDDGFVMRVQTDIATASTGKSNDDQFLIKVQTVGYTFDYQVDWGDSNTDSNVTGDITHTYASPGTYDVTITGTFPNIYFFNRYDRYKVLELKNWGSNQWETMQNAFYGCQNMELTATDTADMSQVTSYSQAFRDCKSVTSFSNAENWVTSNTTTCYLMFYNCIENTAVDTSTWDTSNVTNFSYTFAKNSKLTTLDGSNWDLTKVTNFSQAFEGCYLLTTITGNGNWRFITSGNLNFTKTFDNCYVLDGLNTTNWNMERVTALSETFRDCKVLSELDLTNWDLTNCSSLRLWIYNCPELTTLGDVSSLDTSNITNMQYLFGACDKLTVDVSTWDVSNVTTLGAFANNAGGTGSITGYQNWNTPALAGDLTNAFSYQSNAQDFPLWDASNATTCSTFFRQSTFTNSTKTFNLKTTSALTNCYVMFYSVSSIDDLTIGSDVDWSGVTNFQYTFANMGTLALTFPSNFDWSSGTNFLNILTNTTLSSADYNALLIDIQSSNQNNSITFDAPTCTATGAGLTARTALINDHSWTFNDNS